jgi:uncharacterized membrane protein YciS (DUF1049 family)
MKDYIVVFISGVLLVAFIVGTWYLQYRVKVAAYKQAIIELRQEGEIK